MATKRFLVRGQTVHPEAAVEAFKSRQWLELHRALGLKPWEASPLDAVSDSPPKWWDRNGRAIDDWNQARRLRLELRAAVAAAKAVP